MEKEFYAFGAKHIWAEKRIAPVNDYYTFKLLDESDPIVSDANYYVIKGKKLFDLLTYEDWSQFLISKRLKDVLERERYNGYKCFSTEIEGIADEYFGWLNIAEVGPVIKKTEDNFIVWFDLNTWHNYDFFHLKGTFRNVCTKKVKEVLEQEGITNIEFRPCYGVE